MLDLLLYCSISAVLSPLALGFGFLFRHMIRSHRRRIIIREAVAREARLPFELWCWFQREAR